MGEVLGEIIAFKPSHTSQSIGNYYKQRFWVHFFSSKYRIVEIALNFEKFCSLNMENKVNILESLYEVIEIT